MLTRDELIHNPDFSDALWAFYKMQEWGARYFGKLVGEQPDTTLHPAEYQREEYTISQMLENEAEWRNMDSQQHMAIGKLIAHNFPMFAAICTEPLHYMLCLRSLWTAEAVTGLEYTGLVLTIDLSGDDSVDKVHGA